MLKTLISRQGHLGIDYNLPGLCLFDSISCAQACVQICRTVVRFEKESRGSGPFHLGSFAARVCIDCTVLNTAQCVHWESISIA